MQFLKFVVGVIYFVQMHLTIPFGCWIIFYAKPTPEINYFWVIVLFTFVGWNLWDFWSQVYISMKER
jgi:hypothetical protein